MDGYIEQNGRAIQLGFVASCIEFMARELKETYSSVYERLKRAGLLSEYIYEFYDVLHTQSREHLTEDLIDLLRRREEGACQ